MLTAAIDFLTLASSAIGLILTTMLGLLFRQRRSGTVLVTPLKPASVSNASGTSTSSSTAATKSNVGESLTVAELVSKFCPSLTSRSSTSYRPSWWLPGGHLQTFYCVAGNFNAIDKVKYVRTTLRMPDGGTVSADVSPPDHQSLPADAPTVVMAHGLTGGSHESYVRNVVEWVVRPKSEGGLGGRAVVANFRGCANTPVTTNQFYSAGYTGDYHTVISHVASLYPDSPLVGVGFSLGASVVARYVGEQGDRCLLRGACVLGCPWDIPAMSRTLETGWFSSRVYSHAMAKNLLRTISNHLPRSKPAAATKQSGSSTPSSTTSATTEDSEPVSGEESSDLEAFVASLRKRGRSMRLKDVDNSITCRFGGLRRDHAGKNKSGAAKAAFPLVDADAYYQWASSKPFITHAKRPLLGINALDDPVVSGQSLPVDEISASTHAVLAVTSHGGHLGWFEGPFLGSASRPSQKRWIIKPISEYITAVLDHTKDEAQSRPVVEQDEDGWRWVRGSDDDTYGRVGWREVEGDNIVSGAESSGVLQGL